MVYVPLDLQASDPLVNSVIQGVIEPYLKEAHYLLAATRPDQGSEGHFPRASALMLLGTVAATSSLDNFQKAGANRKGDRAYFVDCLRSYFPWDQVSIEDGEFRAEEQKTDAAGIALYNVFRCPLFHSGGLTDQKSIMPVLIKTHPGHREIEVAEARIEQLARAETMGGQWIMRFEFNRCVLHLDPFYWCVRRMVENYARDPDRAIKLRAYLRRVEH